MSQPVQRAPAPYAISGKSIGWGICGASFASSRMADAIRRQVSPAHADGAVGAWVVSVYSHSQWRASQFAAYHAIPHACSFMTELLARRDVRIVYVGNHPRHHASTTLAALQAGKHVLCEPPLALALDEAQQLVELATERGLVLGVNFQRRADAAISTIHRLARHGDLGDLLHIRVRNVQTLAVAQQTWRLRLPGGGVLLDRSLHSLDLLRYLCADEVYELVAMEGRRVWGAEVEEDVSMLVRMKRGTIAAIHDSYIIPHRPTVVEVVGSQLTLTAVHCLSDEPSLLFAARAGLEKPIALAETDPLVEVVATMQRAAAGEGKPLAEGVDGLRSLETSLVAHQSLLRGAPLRV